MYVVFTDSSEKYWFTTTDSLLSKHFDPFLDAAIRAPYASTASEW